MKRVPCFLTLLGFCMALLACTAAQPSPTPKMAADSVHQEQAEAQAEPRAIDSLYNEAENSLLGRYMRGESLVIAPTAPPQRGTIEFTCLNTGEFNIDPGGDQLLMATWCAQRNPETSVIVVQVDDTVAHRVPGKHVFRILFRDAVVSVQDLSGGRQEVRLHYRDTEGQFHVVDLSPQKNGKYQFSFADLSPDTVEPIGHVRTMEVVD